MNNLLGFPIDPLSQENRDTIRDGGCVYLCYNGCSRSWTTDGSGLIYTASLGVQLFGSDFRLSIPTLPVQATSDSTMEFAVYNVGTGIHERITLTTLLSGLTGAMRVVGIINNASTNPAFPPAPEVGYVWMVGTEGGTVGGEPVEIGDQLLYTTSGRFVIQGNTQLATQSEVDAGIDATKIITSDTNNINNISTTSPTPVALNEEIRLRSVDTNEHIKRPLSDIIPTDTIVQRDQTVEVVAVGQPVYYNNTTNIWTLATETTRTPTGLAVSLTDVVLFGKVSGTFAAADVGRFIYLDDLGGLYAHPTDNGVKVGYIKSTTEMIVDIDKEAYGDYSYNLQRQITNSVGYAPSSASVLVSKKRKYKGYLTGNGNNLSTINTKTQVIVDVPIGSPGWTMCEVEDFDYLIVATGASFRVMDIKTNTFIGGTYSGTGTLPNNGVINSIARIKKQNTYVISSGDNIYRFRLSDPFGGEPFDVTPVSVGYNLAGDRIYDKKICYHEGSNQLFVPNSYVGTVTVLNCETRTINTTITTGQINNKVVHEPKSDLLMVSTRNGGFVLHPTKYTLTTIPGGATFGAYGAGVDLHRNLFVYCGTYPDVVLFIDPRTATTVGAYFGQIGPCDADHCIYSNRTFWVNQNVGNYSVTE